MKDDILTLVELIKIPGASCQEKKIFERIRLALLELGVPEACIKQYDAHLRSSYGGETGNLIVGLEGRGGGVRRLLSTHMDTLPSAVGSDPRIEDNRLINRSPGIRWVPMPAQAVRCSYTPSESF